MTDMTWCATCADWHGPDEPHTQTVVTAAQVAADHESALRHNQAFDDAAAADREAKALDPDWTEI